LPREHAGGGPILVIRRTKQSFTERITPVKPAPDCPPLFVKIVTVSPICFDSKAGKLASHSL